MQHAMAIDLVQLVVQKISKDLFLLQACHTVNPNLVESVVEASVEVLVVVVAVL